MDHALTLPPADGIDPERRTWLLATGAMGAAATAAVAVPFVASFAPSERAKAMGAAVTMDPASVAPGELRTVEWRGQPVWVMRRTPGMLATLETMEGLADPASEEPQQPDYATNTHRSIKPELFVTVGICTHLGCSPNVVPQGSSNPSVPGDWKCTFFCPCHGSTFNLAGRVFRNKPAPTNLVVPPHKYLADGSLLIGEDDRGAA